MSTREHIINQADTLFYQQGFEATSFGDIAKAVGISRGNFYHHFKTKDDLLDGVITQRLARTQAMLDQWQDEGADPRGRIICFIKILITNQAKIKLYGCPVGTLTAELNKLDHHARARAAEVFALFRDWLAVQFRALGYSERSEALALHVLARSQGVATLAQAFKDDAFVASEVEALIAWLDQLTGPKP